MCCLLSSGCCMMIVVWLKCVRGMTAVVCPLFFVIVCLLFVD